MPNSLFNWCSWGRKSEPQPRQVFLGRRSDDQNYPANRSRSQKYSLLTFLPIVLANQFIFFLNIYLLVICLTQAIPDFRIGATWTYYGPLVFVLFVTLVREAVDDYRRYRRDCEINARKYRKLTAEGIVELSSDQIRGMESTPIAFSGICVFPSILGHSYVCGTLSHSSSVSDLIIVKKNQTVPADMVFLRTTEKSGTCFIKTDQLDGETDWKLRITIATTQGVPHAEVSYNPMPKCLRLLADTGQRFWTALTGPREFGCFNLC